MKSAMTTDLAYHDRLCANFLSLDGLDIWALTVLDEMSWWSMFEGEF